jgi:hypothetical protein
LFLFLGVWCLLGWFFVFLLFLSIGLWGYWAQVLANKDSDCGTGASLPFPLLGLQNGICDKCDWLYFFLHTDMIRQYEKGLG